MSAIKRKETVDVTIKILEKSDGNSPKREEWFLDQGLGLFIHWSIDSMLGSVISHWMIGADKEQLRKLYEDLPSQFYPYRFNPDDWARLAKTAGIRYSLFTTKHHAGFCMYDTKTTDFNIMNTPFGKDVTKDIMNSFRAVGIHTGIYFSPLDFTWLLNAGKELHFMTPEVIPANNPGLMEYNETQIREIFENYGPIETVFFDGPPANLKDIVWELNPDAVISRSEMPTPEIRLPEEIIDEPWEACYFMGNSWNYKATNEDYRSGTDIINLLIETRAKGGNLVINISPNHYGEIPPEQERILQEIGLFMFFCDEAIYDVRPWHVPQEKGFFFTRKKDTDTVYAFVMNDPWPHAERRTYTIKSVVATESTKIEIVGQSGKVWEHHPEADNETRWIQDDKGLHIDARRTFRPYSSRNWPNPIVFRITNAAKAN
ncbi:MAG: alpha-L-fucosidase [Clostridiales bacterium]|nr:alpha-L-fucosidase [Clostridiales bacterium]